MNPMPELIPMLKELRLSGILDSLELRNRQAIEEKLAFTDFLALLLQDKVARRANRKLSLRFRKAAFRNHKTLEDFDFAFNHDIAGEVAKPGELVAKKPQNQPHNYGDNANADEYFAKGFHLKIYGVKYRRTISRRSQG